MTATRVLERYGTLALVRFTSLLLVFTGLHLARLPFLAVARVLGWAMTVLDTELSTPPAPRTARHHWGDRWGEAIPSTRRRRRRASAGHRPDYGPAHHPTSRNPGVGWPDPVMP
ncbi:hypothetical protein [Amycolatopsis sp. DSM 110486]|uniref:hypothetical protein n=1 Tax=Amycolatopsis sp. DSM 110486 TaxID=2865832 RepID=UPI001C6A306E|nr:hypothetical protein [Amycolatopsis sp. DSM 110486]QYN23746.1 hypothetical protein K1T34_15605 [Amycolatopsis sp. DSM 110486]